MSNRLRLPTRSDAERICYQLKRAMDRVPESDVVRGVYPDVVVERIVAHKLRSVIVDNAYLIVYDVGCTWYSDRLYLQEQMVLRLSPGSNFTAVCLTLEYLREQHQCQDIFVGGALAFSARALTRLYQRAGFEQLTIPSLIKRG